MDPGKLIRLAAGGISTIPPFADKHPEEALPHARQALISAGIIKGLEKDAMERRRSKRAALWFPRSSFPYRGDLKAIALNPSSGLTMDSREVVLDEHYRRMSAEPPYRFADAAARGAVGGALFGGAVVGLRAAGAFREGGMALADAVRAAVKPALVGAGVGAAVGIPVGIAKGYNRIQEIRRARAYTGADIPTRRSMVRAEVNKSLGVG